MTEHQKTSPSQQPEFQTFMTRVIWKQLVFLVVGLLLLAAAGIYSLFKKEPPKQPEADQPPAAEQVVESAEIDGDNVDTPVDEPNATESTPH